ncbi:DUF3769 domain-containing protein [Gloeobacter kilaueensis]|uniref:Organic solvent tolerance-like N-terminal domain-containing protein n=1 Tax=Gloeobacter kilaueensis (strain ATCC BAA-2537 / CCAP 1431/1 / ULC 316 / JS1) TaxID=1183438 RepID=U5QHP1_GLOK1|nr:DUF3769 domain-containing protein [Gloeobacter kilaueensis]AGY58383.1 hypothetical protein GKIL_2137 [Gloeobacter kilaueensis JS1]
MPYFPVLPPPPPPLVLLAEALPEPQPPVARVSDLQAQAPGQASDLGKNVDNSRLRPAEEGLSSGGALKPGDQIFLDADDQQYDQTTHIFTARGNVKLRLNDILLSADQMQVNLDTRLAVAEGHLTLVQGEQRLSGRRLEYNFARKEGVLLDAQGRIDTKPDNTAPVPNSPLATDPGPIAAAAPVAPKARGGILRFHARRITFSPQGAKAEDLRATPDQFDPPELEVISNRATLVPNGPGSNRLTIDSGTILFDQTTTLPFPTILSTIDKERRKPPYEIGADYFDKGGIYYQQNFYIDFSNKSWLSFSPQFYIQQAFSSRGFLDPANFGIQSKLNLDYGNGQITKVFLELNGLDLGNLENRLRGRIDQILPLGNHTLTFNFSYNERFFNYVVGYQIAHSILGITLDSPVINLGNTGVLLSYQVNAALINAISDRPNLPAQPDLSRLRLAGSLSKQIPLVVGTYLPPSRETLRFTQQPVTPGLWLDLGTTLSQSWYSSGDSQTYLGGRVGLSTIIGRFTKDLFDYTSLNIGYNNGYVSGLSPFLFDRVASAQQIYGGIQQQIYGPVRAGVQVAYDLFFRKVVDNYFSLSFDRRTYSLSLIYNPVLQTGGFQLRVDDFNWGTNQYGKPDQVTTVLGGVERFNRTGP